MNQAVTSDYPMTLEGKRLLDEELDRLLKVDREDVKRAIAEARELGDLKENSEYQAAKERQSLVEGRIGELQAKLGRAQVIDPESVATDHIVFGAKVSLYCPDKDTKFHYQIVGEDEADLQRGKISFKSPLGKALIGKQEGDTVVVKAPKGDLEYEVESFTYR